MNALAARYPALGAMHPVVALSRWPTPLEPAGHLLAALDPSTRRALDGLRLKRDDGAGDTYGGNKLRKLEYLLGETTRGRHDAVLTFGTAGSNHALATAIQARRLGLGCYAVLVDQPRTPWVADTLRWHVRLGTRLIHARGFAGSSEAARRVIESHPSGPEKVHEIPWGGSSVSGTLGFVNAGMELAAQVRAAGLSAPLRVYLPCGTMGSAAGLLLGLRLAEHPGTVVAVKVVPQDAVNAGSLMSLVHETEKSLGAAVPDLHTSPAPGPPMAAPAVGVPAVGTAGVGTDVVGTAVVGARAAVHLEFRENFFGTGYAVPTPEALEAAALAADAGLSIDTTYSGKALAALLADARAGLLAGTQPIFWLTFNSHPHPADLDEVSPADLPLEFRHYLAR